MATPTLTKHSIPGVLGPILLDVRTADKTSSRPAVLVLHGFKGFKDWGMFPPLAERLARAGFTVLSPNLSGSGVDDSGEFTFPDQFGHNTFSAELQDTALVLDALMSGVLQVAGPSSVGLLGHSRGGGIGILQAARDPRLRALVTWSSISTVQRWPASERSAWRSEGKTEIRNARTGQILPLYTDVLDDVERNAPALDIGKAAERVQVPWLMIHGTEDESVGFSEAEVLKAAASSRTTALLPVEGAGHTFGAVHPWRSATPHLEKVFDATLAWFSAHLS